MTSETFKLSQIKSASNKNKFLSSKVSRFNQYFRLNEKA